MDDIHDKFKIINEEDNTAISQATKLPRELLFDKEKDDNNALPSRAIRVNYQLTQNTVKVSNEALISCKGCKYSVLKKYLCK